MPPSKICGGCVMQLNENITGLQHLGIPTLDLEATKAFYDVLCNLMRILQVYSTLGFQL